MDGLVEGEETAGGGGCDDVGFGAGGARPGGDDAFAGGRGLALVVAEEEELGLGGVETGADEVEGAAEADGVERHVVLEDECGRFAGGEEAAVGFVMGEGAGGGTEGGRTAVNQGEAEARDAGTQDAPAEGAAIEGGEAFVGHAGGAELGIGGGETLGGAVEVDEVSLHPGIRGVRRRCR